MRDWGLGILAVRGILVLLGLIAWRYSFAVLKNHHLYFTVYGSEPGETQ